MGPSLISCMKPNSKRLYQCALHGIHIIRQLKAKSRLMSYILLEDTVNRRCCKEHHIGTEVIFALTAELTMPASLSRLKRHTVTYFEMPDILADLHNSSSRLMT